MKILVTSDTHGIYEAISDYIILHDDIDLLIHAGDGVSDVKSIAYETGINYYVVKGNNDYYDQVSYDQVINLGAKKIFLTHGHRYDVYFTYDKIIDRAKSLNCDVAIFGHTHQYVNEKRNGILLLNPSSPTLPRDGNRGFIILDIDKDIKVNRILIN